MRLPKFFWRVFIFFWVLAGAAQVAAMGKKPSDSKPEEMPPLPQKNFAQQLLTLHDCYRLSLKRSESLAIRDEDIEIARAQFFAASATVLGDVDFVWTDFIQDELKGTTIDPTTGGSVQTTLNDPERLERRYVIRQPLFQGFKSLAALRGAKRITEQRKDERHRAEQLLFQDVADAFFLVLQQKKNIEIITGILRLYEGRIGELEEREEIGRSRVSEIAEARSKMKSLEADLARSRGLLLVTKHLLEFLTGVEIDPDRLVEDQAVQPNYIPLEQMLRRAEGRPDVEAAYHAFELSKSNVIVAQSGFWPVVTFENNVYDRREGFQEDIHWDVLFRAVVPLFRGGENVGLLKEALSECRQAKLRHAETRRRAYLDIKQAHTEWERARNQYAALEEARLASEENFVLQQEDYRRNLVNNLTVLDALEQLNIARREANLLYYEKLLRYWRLKVATGDVE